MFLTILVHGQEILCKISTKPWGGVVLRGARSFYFFSISLGLSNIKKKITLRGSLSIHLKRKLILSNRKNLKNQSQHILHLEFKVSIWCQLILYQCFQLP